MTEKANGKAEKFRSLAEQRVSRVIKAIRNVSKLSQRNRYEYDEAQVEQIFKALNVELDEAIKNFAPPTPKDKGQILFRFE